MKNRLSIFVYCLLLACTSVSWTPLQKARVSGQAALPLVFSSDNSSSSIDSLYMAMDLREKGLSKQAFAFAYKGYRRLLKKNIVNTGDYLMICDFSQSSGNKRLYLLDMQQKKVIVNTYVAHGRRSGGKFATRFSNKPQSQQSSLGFYIAKNTYYGEHGLSLRMAGLEKGYNDKALQRNIVIHGADYIGEAWLKKGDYMGRSYGCPALPKQESSRIINTLKNGSCIFIYHPSPGYLHGSKLLND